MNKCTNNLAWKLSYNYKTNKLTENIKLVKIIKNITIKTHK